MGALSRWATIEKAAKLADLGVKLSAIIVALLAANFFLLRPDVQTDRVVTQRRVDPVELARLYTAKQSTLPALVERTIVQYDNDEQLYLDTLGARPPFSARLASSICALPVPVIPEAYFTQPRKALCAEAGKLLAEVAVEHELRLLQNYALARIDLAQVQKHLAPDGPKLAPLTERQLVQALRSARDATYFIDVYKITNEGRAAADPVRVVPPGGYTQISEEPLVGPLSPGNQRIFEFRTERAPRSQIEVSWDARPSDPANTAVKVLLVVFMVLVAAVIINDLYRSTKDHDATGDRPGGRRRATRR